jgi:hypothetical protein
MGQNFGGSSYLSDYKVVILGKSSIKGLNQDKN